MKNIGEMSQLELAAFVSDHLKKIGIDVVLSGGAAVSFYTRNLYISNDVDLINIHLVSRRRVNTAMDQIGFIEKGRYHKHPNNPFIIEFPTGPLSVGREPVKEIETVSLATGVLQIISPTDCVKDRLCAFYYWNDLQALRQAQWVTQSSNVDQSEIERWSVVENKADEYQIYLDSLSD